MSLFVGYSGDKCLERLSAEIRVRLSQEGEVSSLVSLVIASEHVKS